MITAINIYFAAAPRGGMRTVVEALRATGATRAGCVSWPRVPIDVVIDTGEWLDHADVLGAEGDEWKATVTATPWWSIAVEWQVAAGDESAAMLAELGALGGVDYGVALVYDNDQPQGDVDGYRTRVIGALPAIEYGRGGPGGLGAITWVGPRVLALMDAASRDALIAAASRRLDDGTLVLGADAQAAEAFAQSGVARRYAPAGNAVKSTAGPAWQAPAAPPPPAPYAPEAADAIRALHAPVGDDLAVDIEVAHMVAPFAPLPDMRAERLEIEGAKLAFAELRASELYDSGLVEADLRGAHAPRARWIDVAAVGADLRWANLHGAELAETRFEEADLSFADLTDAVDFTEARSAKLDDIQGDRLAVSTRYAALSDASFVHASLRGARFDGADLQRACFDGADLTGASFRGADLRGASFEGAKLEGTDFDGATRDGAPS
jgi:uncharacterized protein YjbI with pentapeptide repeats